VIFRNLCTASEDDPSRIPILMVLAEMASLNKNIGYLLLYFVKVSKTQDVASYKDFSKHFAKDLSSCLLNDLRACQEDDVRMFCYILPDVYRDFEGTVISNSQFMHLTVSCIDASQLQDLICYVLQGDMRMLKKETIVSIINASLEWETFEQFCLWQLISAHNIPIESILPVLPKLEFQLHSEALTNILLLLKRIEPTQDTLKHLLNRDVKQEDSFVVSVLKCWIRNHDKKLAELISTHLNKSLSSPVKRGKARNNTSKTQLNTIGEQVLSHLDHLRQKSKLASFFNHENIQAALSSAQSACTDAQKTTFSDLFALMEDNDPKPKRGTKSATKGIKAKKRDVEESNSDTDASEDEPVTRTNSKSQASSRKKRKTVNASDSD
jgi:integrator complex subunit 3